MRVPVSWLRDYVPIAMPLGELATKLSISSAEVEGLERRGVVDEGGNLDLFKVGRVLEAEKHPNADRCRSPGSTSASPSPARSSAAPGTSAPAPRSASRYRGRCCRTVCSSTAAPSAGSSRTG